MPRGLPQLTVVNVGRHHLLVAPLAVLSPNELHQGVIDVGTTWQEETAPRTQLVEKIELLLTT